MGRVAILKIGQGDFNQGFEVSLEIKDNRGQSLAEITGRLPANDKIDDLYRSWAQSFDRITGIYRKQQQLPNINNDAWEIDESLATNIASSDLLADCRQKVQYLEANMQAWLRQSANGNWQRIRERLAKELAQTSEEIRLVIKIDRAELQTKLWKLPWHVWDLLLDCPDVGIGYSLGEFDRPNILEKPLPKHNKVRILAIFGDDDNLDLEADRQAIKTLRDAESVFLVRPSSRELIQQLRAKEGWNIFFFAGHSQSEGQTGRIYINESESLTIDQFRNALREAIGRGLKIAIFNSCDGLGLARRLADLHIPVVIAMREIVPDRVAQSFVKEFLSEYARGEPLYTSVRRAQVRLEEFTDVPGATWLPLIYQNPAVIPPRWQDLFQKTTRQWSQFRQVALISLAIASSIMGMRWFGILQPWELRTYDRLMQLRPKEVRKDSRILVVTIDDPDIKYQTDRNLKKEGSLSDRALTQLLDELEKLRPSTIGLDIYHPSPFEADLAKRLRKDKRFFAICKVRSLEDDRDLYGKPPPRELPPQRWGFSDVLIDGDGVVRRHLLTMTPPSTDPCNTKLSFASLLALHYLSTKEKIEAKLTPTGEWQLGKVVFKQLKDRSSGYQGIDARGYQTLLNYRSYSSPEYVVEAISLQQVLQQGISRHLIARLPEPIVAIGNIDKTYNDYFRTPYDREIPGVFLQAQMISQILSAVLDGRSLIWWWSGWVEAAWVWGWSMVGGVLIIYNRHPLRLFLNLGGGAIAISSISLVLFSYGGWIPLVPPVLAWVITTVVVDSAIRHNAFEFFFLNRRKQT